MSEEDKLIRLLRSALRDVCGITYGNMFAEYQTPIAVRAKHALKEAEQHLQGKE